MNFTLLPIQKLSVFVSTFLFVTNLSGQSLQITNGNVAPFTPQNLISNVFLGDGVNVTNIQYQGTNSAVGYFSGGTSAIGINRGILLTTGIAATDGNNLGADEVGDDFASVDNLSNISDPDLGKLFTGNPPQFYNMTKYTITFVPTSDTLRFRYAFASEEYPEFGCSNYNDVFGFFIQGPGYPTPKNIALIPGTNLPVSINNIHPDNPVNTSCKAEYLQYFNNNDNNTTKQPTYDGFTDVFTAMAIVQPCQTYTIKLIIADVGDEIYDSGVFLEAKSFGTGVLDAEILTASQDGTVTEGCSDGTFSFKIPEPTNVPTNIDYNIWGTATNGTDIQTIPMGLVIPAGATEVSVPIVAIEDNLTEVNEYIAIDFQKDPCRRDTIYIYVRDNSIKLPQLRGDTSLCVSGAANLDLDATLPVLAPDPMVFTNQNDVSISPVWTAVFSPINVVGVQPVVLTSGMIRSVCVNLQHNYDDDLDIYLISPGGQFLELSTDNGGSGDNYTNTCFTPVAVSEIANGNAPFSGNFSPDGDWSELAGSASNGQWKLQVTDDFFDFFPPAAFIKDWTITFEPAYKIDYQWTPGTDLSCVTCPKPTATPTTTQTYKVVATDNYGCAVSDSVKIEVEQTLAAPQTSCSDVGQSEVTFSWTNVPNSTGFQININGAGWISAPAGNQFTATGLSPGTATTLMIQATGTNLLCPPLVDTAVCRTCSIPLVQAATVQTSCYNTSDGSLILTPDGLNPPYSFKFNNQTNTTGSFSNLAGGIYSATITDNDGCFSIENITIPSPAAVVAQTSVPKPISCNNANDGSISVQMTGGTGNFTYKWSVPGNPTTATVNNLPPGNYTVTATDSKGCTATATASLTNPPALSVNISANDAKCFGSPTGSATANPTGGSGNFTYLWTNGQTSQIAIGLSANNYTVTATDANGCTTTATTTVGQPTQLLAAVSAQPAKCFGESNGSATANPSGGTSNYSFKWSDPLGQTAATATNLKAGNYLVTVTDAQNCSVISQIAVAQPTEIETQTNLSNALCFGEKSGAILISATGGNGGFTFNWPSGIGQSTDSSVSNLAAGNYDITLTDAKGCVKLVKTTITQPTDLAAPEEIRDVKCAGNLTGSITILPGGGVLPYQFGWSNGSNSQNQFSLAAGTYTLTMTDANGCTAVFVQKIQEPSEIKAEILPTAVKCFGENTGSLTTNLTGGDGNFTIKWSGQNGVSSSDFNLQNLPAGKYFATVTDGEGCLKIFSTEILQPAAALETGLADIADTVCFDKTNGKITANPTGGTQPYNFSWSIAGQTGNSISDLPIGFYHLTITDANNCKSTDSTVVTQQQPIFAVLDSDPAFCHDGHDGKAKVSKIFYGAAAFDLDEFQYEWGTTPKQTGAFAFNLAAGQTYKLTATDAAGCTAEHEILVGNPDAVGAEIDSIGSVKCFGEATGWAAVSGFGGTGGFHFLWSPNAPNQNGQVAQNLAAGKYQVTVTDANGCFGKKDLVIEQPKPLNLTFEKTDIKCFGETNGTAKVGVSGGVPSYLFLWSNGTQTAENQGLPVGFAAVLMTDGNGCKIQDSIKIKAPAEPISGVQNKKDAVCFGSATGEIQITGTGGEPPYKYSLDGQKWNGSSRQIGLKAGIYNPVLKDKNGCIFELPEIAVGQRGAIDVNLGPDITINLGDEIQLFAEVENATQPIEFIWSLEDSIWLSCLDCRDPFVDSLIYQNGFEIYVVDSAGCTAEDRIVVFVEKIRKVFVPTGFTPNGDFQNDKLLVHGQKEVKILDFRVFDRWGELLWEAENFDINDPITGWDGNFRDREMPAGVYVWVMEVEYKDGVKEVFKGNSTLVR